MLATSEAGLFPGHNHLLTNSPDDPSLIIARAPFRSSQHGGCLVDSGFLCSDPLVSCFLSYHITLH